MQPESSRPTLTARAPLSATTRLGDPVHPGGQGDPRLYRMAVRASWVSALFSAVVLALLLINAVSSRGSDPLTTARVVTLRRELVRRPDDAGLRREFRELDQRLRRGYFTGTNFASKGALLLAGGLLVLLISTRYGRQFRKRLPDPLATRRADAWALSGASRRSVLVVAALALSGLGLLAALSRRDIAAEYAKAAGLGDDVVLTSAGYASDDEMAQNWPSFRGFHGAGSASGDGYPLAWDGTKGEGVLWKSPIPLPGESSPVVWGDRVFLTGADEGRREVYCYDANTGKLIWRREVGPPSRAVATGGSPSRPTPAAAPPQAPTAASGDIAATTRPGGAAGTGDIAATTSPGGAPSGDITASVSPGGGASGDITATASPGGAASGDITASVSTGGGAAGSKAGSGSSGGGSGDITTSVSPGGGTGDITGTATSGSPAPSPSVPPAASPAPSAPGGGAAPAVSADTGYAASTLATDGRRLYAIFATGHVACLDFDGKTVWTRSLGTPQSMYGHASSLVTWRDRLIIQFDQGANAEDGKSALLALDTATGTTLWSTKRPVPNSWSSPIVVTVGASEQIITCGSPWVIAYDPATGAELWRCDVLSGDVAPTPVFAGGRVFAANTGSNLAAIRPDRRGNVTRSAVLWKAQDGLPDMVSPVSDGDLTLLVSSTLATCYDAKTGAKLWEQEFGAPFRSSPTLVGKRVYLADTEGVTHVLELSRTPKILRANPLGEPINASPAFVKGRIFVRGKQSLYCLGGGRG